MRASLHTRTTPLHDDASVIAVGFGGCGRTVVRLLQQELTRRGVAEERAAFLAFDVEPAADETEAGWCVRIEPFDAAAYVALPENDALRAAVAHVPSDALAGLAAGRTGGVPAAGLVAFHHDDESRLTTRFRALVDAVRTRNPAGEIHCFAVWGLGGGFGNGVAVPFLCRVREHLESRRVALHAFLVTPEAQANLPGADAAALQSRCAAAALLWERLQRGETFAYPGKEGVREDRTFRGPIAKRTWIFSGGAGTVMAGPQGVASVVAHSMATLLTSPLGATLEHERSAYAEDLLDCRWSGSEGGLHPTALLTLNVGGVRLDPFPSIYPLRAARSFLDEVTRALPAGGQAQVRTAVESCRREARLVDGDLVHDLGVGGKPLTREEVAASRVTPERLHGWIAGRLEEDVGALLRLAEGGVPAPAAEGLLERARTVLAGRAHTVAHTPGFWLPGAVQFWTEMQRSLESSRDMVLEHAALARAEFGATPNRARLDTLLERLRRDTIPGATVRGSGVVERFVATVTVSVPTQVRKILEVATEIRTHAQVMASSAVLAEIYARLAIWCEGQREALQGRVYTANNLASRCMREEEQVERAARGAFTYQRTRFATLVNHLWDVLRDRVPPPSTPSVVAQLGGDLPAFLASEGDALGKLVGAVAPDGAALAASADALLAEDALFHAALQEALAPFVPAVQVDRERFATLRTARSRWVLCTPRLYAAHRDTLFAGMRHVPTSDPFTVLCTQNEEGLPFAALGFLRTCSDAFSRAVQDGRGAVAAVTAECASSTARLDG